MRFTCTEDQKVLLVAKLKCIGLAIELHKILLPESLHSVPEVSGGNLGVFSANIVVTIDKTTGSRYFMIVKLVTNAVRVNSEAPSSFPLAPKRTWFTLTVSLKLLTSAL